MNNDEQKESENEKKKRILELTKDIGPFHVNGMMLPPVNAGGCHFVSKTRDSPYRMTWEEAQSRFKRQ